MVLPFNRQVMLWVAFFLSGAAGLSYELCWVRYLSQVFGATTPAISATIAVFFTGMAIGAQLGGRVFGASARPLRSYALLELSIGAAAALVPLLFRAADALLRQRSSEEPAGTLLLLGLSAAILLVPTILLGATFPGMAAVVRGLGAPARVTGLFYGINTLGAVLGCLLVTFALLPALGQAQTSWVMALGNGLIALLAGCLSATSRWRGTSAASPTSLGAEPAPAPAAQAPLLGPAAAALLAGGTGYLGIAIEVLWTRALALSFIGSMYVFGLILAAYLSGIGAGAVMLGVLHARRPPTLKGLAAVLVAATLGGLITLLLLPQLPQWFLSGLIGGWIGTWPSYIGALGASAIVVMLPATIAMGASLPLIVALAVRGPVDMGRTAGRLYALNTVGGVAGSLSATFVLMPLFGLSRALNLLTFGYAALALLCLRRAELPRALRRGLLAVLLVGLPLAAAGLGPEVNILKERPGRTLLHYQDDPGGTIEVSEDTQGVRSLRVNNHYGLSTTEPATVAMQYTLGQVPLFLHPAPRRALLIGFATGTTLAAMATHPLERLDCVELHGTLFALAPLFAAANHEVFRDPRVGLLSEDGTRFLSRGGAPYDVIVGDLYLPTLPGVGALYSLEHFQAVRRRLSPGGVFVAWLPLFQLGTEEMAVIARTFLAAFPNGEAWMGWWNPQTPVLGLVGDDAGSAPHVPEGLAGQLRARLRSSLPQGRPGGVLVEDLPPPARILDTQGLRALAGSGPLERLERPVVELLAPRSIFLERAQGRPLARAHLRRIGQLRPLGGTPWAGIEAELRAP